MSIEEKINYVETELEYRSDTAEYINQLNHAINDAKHKLDNHTFLVILNTQMETLEQPYDYKDDNIIALKKDNVRIKKEIIILKEEIIKKDVEIQELKFDVNNLKKKNTEYERNEKLIYVTQACLNMQMYIVKKVTKWNKREYRKNYEQDCGNNYNEFKEYYPEYYEAAIELEKELQIDDLLPTIKKLKDDRNLISHPNKIDIEKLNIYCEDICSKYGGITKIGKNYEKIDVSLLD